MADYNLLVDKLNTDTDRADVEAEAAELKAANDAESREVEALFAEKQASFTLRTEMIIDLVVHLSPPHLLYKYNMRNVSEICSSTTN